MPRPPDPALPAASDPPSEPRPDVRPNRWRAEALRLLASELGVPASPAVPVPADEAPRPSAPSPRISRA